MVDRIVTGEPAAQDADTAARNLALDEALLRAAPGTAALWVWRNPPCVVVGRGQTLAREVDLAACARDHVPVLRRATGGGTVYHDLGNLNLTLVLPGPAPAPVRLLGEILTRAVASLGLTAVTTERGLFVDGAKLSGFAALRTARGTLAHATLLVSTPAGSVQAYLAPAPRVAHLRDSHRAPVASLADHGVNAEPATAAAALLDAAAHVLGPVRVRPPNPAERRWRQWLLSVRYGHPAWHLTGRQKQEGPWTAEHASTSTARWC